MSIDPTFIAIWVVIGIVLGGIASFIVKPGTLGLVGDAIVGLVGGLIAGYVLPRVGVYIGAGFVPEGHQRRHWRGRASGRRPPCQNPLLARACSIRPARELRRRGPAYGDRAGQSWREPAG